MKKRSLFKQDKAFSSWAIVGALALVMTGFYGAQFSFGIFLKPILEEFGWTRAMTSGAISIVSGVAGLSGILMGRLTDRYGARMLITIGALLGGLGYLLLSQISSLWQLYVYFGVTVGICIGSAWTPINATVSKLFDEKRVLALGITNSGITAGRILLPPIVAYVTTGYQWRQACIMLAFIVWAVAIPAVMLLGRNRSQGAAGLPHDISTSDSKGSEVGKPIKVKQLSATEAVRTVPFWMIAATGYVAAAGFFFVSVHIVAYATDRGIDATTAALLLSFMGGISILARLSVAQVNVMIGSRATLFLSLLLQALALLLLTQAASLWMLFALGAVYGLGFGCCGTIRMSMASEFFGVGSIGAIIGLTSVAWSIGGMTGPIMAGYIFDLTRSYNIAFIAGGLLMVMGMVASLFLKPPRRIT
ncbi:MFS transporter [Chloroflexota bacterium]